ncbi:MAG TPA: DUF302 domain-containing protein [Burkholderiaceae bacterium]
MSWISTAGTGCAALLALTLLCAVPVPGVGQPAGKGADGLTFTTAPVRIARIQVREGVSFDDAVESMRLRANQRNLKYVGVNQLGREIETLSGRPWRRIEILSFCDGLVAQKMIEADPSMLAYMPCRIGALEDDQHRIWLIAMLIDEAVMQALPASARDSAQRVTATLREIMVAGARGDL